MNLTASTSTFIYISTTKLKTAATPLRTGNHPKMYSQVLFPSLFCVTIYLGVRLQTHLTQISPLRTAFMHCNCNSTPLGLQKYIYDYCCYLQKTSAISYKPHNVGTISKNYQPPQLLQQAIFLSSSLEISLLYQYRTRLQPPISKPSVKENSASHYGSNLLFQPLYNQV